MIAGAFARKLRHLNPELRIWCGDDDSKPAGLFYVYDGEYEHICGVDKNFVPKFTVFSDRGRIIKSGYVRVLKILVGMGLVNKQKAEMLFGVRISDIKPKSAPKDKSKIMEYLRDCQKKGYFKPDELVDIGREIQRVNPTDEEKLFRDILKPAGIKRG